MAQRATTPRGDATRRRLLDTALALFSERGVDAVSMREIAARADVNVAVAYHHFGSKRGLFLAVCDRLGFTDALATANVSAGVELQRLLADTWTAMLAGVDFIRLWTIESLKGDPDARSLGGDFREAGHRLLEEALRAEGLPPARARDLATVLRRLIWGTFVEALLHDETDALVGEAKRTANVLRPILAPKGEKR